MGKMNSLIHPFVEAASRRQIVLWKMGIYVPEGGIFGFPNLVRITAPNPASAKINMTITPRQGINRIKTNIRTLNSVNQMSD